MVSKEQFIKDIQAIYGAGNLSDAYVRLKFLYGQNADFKEEGIYEKVLTKFKEHVEAWRRRYGDREEKYISEKARSELKNIHDFLGAGMWTHDFKGLTQSKSRDKYLFPNKPINVLLDELNEFKQ